MVILIEMLKYDNDFSAIKVYIFGKKVLLTAHVNVFDIQEQVMTLLYV